MKEGDYYSQTEKLPNYITDYNDYKYGEYSLWNKENCNLSDEFYTKERQMFRSYNRIAKIKSVELVNFTYNDNLKIYYKDKIIGYDIVSNEDNILKINLKSGYPCDYLLFYVENAENYTINLYVNNRFETPMLSKKMKKEKLSMPDKTWITENTKYIKYEGNVYYEITDLTTLANEYEICRYREKYFYKYQIKKEYYDNNYYTNVDGYIKDKNDYKIFYKGEPIVNTIEITKEKIIKEPQIEYVYVPIENEIQKNDSSNTQTDANKQTETNDKKCLPKIETKIVEKEIFKTPKKLYIIIIILILLIIVLIKKCLKNMSTKTNRKYCRNHIKK